MISFKMGSVIVFPVRIIIARVTVIKTVGQNEVNSRFVKVKIERSFFDPRLDVDRNCGRMGMAVLIDDGDRNGFRSSRYIISNSDGYSHKLKVDRIIRTSAQCGQIGIGAYDLDVITGYFDRKQ